MLIVTKNFPLTEVRRASQSVPTARLYAEPMASHISETLRLLERIRATLGARPVIISSMVRSVTHNAEVGGSSSSAHISGYAADIEVDGLTPVEVMNILAPQARALAIDQIIIYDGHVHVSADPRGRAQLLDGRSGGILPWLGAGATPATVAADATAVATAPVRSTLARFGCGSHIVLAFAFLGAGSLILWM